MNYLNCGAHDFPAKLITGLGPASLAALKGLPATQAAPKELKNNNENIDNNTVSGPEWANEIQEMKNKINLLTESYNEILNILINLN